MQFMVQKHIFTCVSVFDFVKNIKEYFMEGVIMWHYILCCIKLIILGYLLLIFSSLSNLYFSRRIKKKKSLSTQTAIQLSSILSLIRKICYKTNIKIQTNPLKIN